MSFFRVKSSFDVRFAAETLRKLREQI